MKKLHYEELPPLLKKLKDDYGYVYFDDGDYDLNIIGVRKLGDDSGFNQFNDRIFIIYKKGDIWVEESGAATTDPGRYWLLKPDYHACAIMKHPQQARGAYKLGIHRGYEALTQCTALEYWRDGSKDEILDYKGKVFKKNIALNIHRSSTREGGSVYVDRHSAGCQVWQDPIDFRRMLELCKLQIKTLGYRTFTYTLIAEE